MGANEAADRLLSHKLFSKSRQMRFTNLQTRDKAKRILKTAAEIEQILRSDPDSDNIFLPHWVFEVYPFRPDKLEKTSLYEFLDWYEKVPSSSSNKDLELKNIKVSLR